MITRRKVARDGLVPVVVRALRVIMVQLPLKDDGLVGVKEKEVSGGA